MALAMLLVILSKKKNHSLFLLSLWVFNPIQSTLYSLFLILSIFDFSFYSFYWFNFFIFTVLSRPHFIDGITYLSFFDVLESWCEVQVKPASPEVTFCSVNDPSILEALLKEAQKEGSTTTQSRSGINTPLSFHGSNISPQDLDKDCADWIWDWSSRPEVNVG